MYEASEGMLANVEFSHAFKRAVPEEIKWAPPEASALMDQHADGYCDFVNSRAASSFQRVGFFLRFIVRRLAVPVFLFTLELDAAARRAGLLDTVRPVARRLTPPSARLFNFLSAAFSCLRLALSKVTTLPWPNSRAQAISVP